MKDFKVSFFKLKKEQDEKGKEIITGEEYLCCVVIDDCGTGKELTLQAKAFRHAPSISGIADKVVVERVG